MVNVLFYLLCINKHSPPLVAQGTNAWVMIYACMRNNLSKHGIIAFKDGKVNLKVIDHFRNVLPIDYTNDIVEIKLRMKLLLSSIKHGGKTWNWDKFGTFLYILSVTFHDGVAEKLK